MSDSESSPLSDTDRTDGAEESDQLFVVDLRGEARDVQVALVDVLGTLSGSVQQMSVLHTSQRVKTYRPRWTSSARRSPPLLLSQLPC
jgi:hypothetical protein